MWFSLGIHIFSSFFPPSIYIVIFREQMVLLFFFCSRKPFFTYCLLSRSGETKKMIFSLFNITSCCDARRAVSQITTEKIKKVFFLWNPFGVCCFIVVGFCLLYDCCYLTDEEPKKIKKTRKIFELEKE